MDVKILMQFPKDLRKEHQHIINLRNEMEAYYVFAKNLPEIWRSLQTSHCLEIVLTGSCKVHSSECTHKLIAQDIHFRKRGNYTIEPSEDYSSLLYFFENPFIINFLKEHVEPSFQEELYAEIPPFLFKTSPFIIANTQETIDVIQNTREYNSCIAKFSLHQILLQILDRAPDKKYLAYLRYLIHNKKIDLHYYLETNFTENLDLKTLAKQTGRSLSSFKTDFKKEFHTTPQKWLLSRRLKHANHLIKNSTDPISDIAYQSGFENISHFSRVYKDKFGFSPIETRK